MIISSDKSMISIQVETTENAIFLANNIANCIRKAMQEGLGVQVINPEFDQKQVIMSQQQAETIREQEAIVD